MNPTVFNHILLPSPPAFAIASPSPERGEAMAKAGGRPSCRAGAEHLTFALLRSLGFHS